MKITSREPAAVHSTSGCDWHHICAGQLHSELERTHIHNYDWLLLLGTSCTANL